MSNLGVKVDSARADAIYLAVSEFVAAHASSCDADSPGTLVTALCRVLADAVEVIPATDQKKLEAIVRLTAHFMGFEDAMLFLGKDADKPS